MYIRANKRGSRTYYYIVESVRKGERVIQKVILYLGTAETVLKKLKSKEN
jgi:hypothetical protein